MKPILNELKEIIETMILPDGDHIDIPTGLYLEGLYERIRKINNINVEEDSVAIPAKEKL